MRARSNLTSKCLPALLLLPGLALALGGTSCHIHPPGSSPQKPLGIIGPYPSVRACEAERLERFGAAGRCHCVADFSPRRPGENPDSSPAAAPQADRPLL